MGTWDTGDGVVELPDGRRVRGTGRSRPRDGAPAPEHAVYLLGRDPQVSEWPYRWVRWPDFGLPTSTDDALDALVDAHARAGAERVEIACAGGMGRTGTALAVLAALSGIEPDDAVAWVREHYHPRAVETRRQQRWVREVASTLRR